ncbi:histone deacetylation protein Rxt3-domain-containing protein, partial [Lasiosphaeris hirsuta]
MDPRQQPPPQHPFSTRNAASPFGRPSYGPPQPSNQNQPPYPNASHPPPNAPPYADLHARKPSDPAPYYPPSRQYPPEPGPMPPTSTHSRHQSASSIASGPPMNRGMPPPTSPPQQHHQQPHQQPHQQTHQQPPQGPGPGPGPGAHQISGPYNNHLPHPHPRPPPVSVGPPTAFPRGRELPALESLPRTGTSGSSMSISSMLGGPPPARDPPPPAQYAPGPPPGVSGPPYSQPMHASPRMHPAAAPEYPNYRRPQTPERHRIYDSRDPRANTAASPSGAYSTPEGPRYGTPQAYPPRGPPLTAAEQSRDQGRLATAVPPRPTSQPKSFPSAVPPRPMEMGRQGDMYPHREDMRQPEEYNPERPIRVKYEVKYEDPRYMSERERQDRERHEREMELREREHRERTMSGGDVGRQHGYSLSDYARALEQTRAMEQQMDPRAPLQYGHQPHWQPRPGYEPARPPYDPAAHLPRQRQEYPPATGPQYNGHPAYGPGPVERHPPSSRPPHQHVPPPGPGHVPSYESPDRQRVNHMHHPSHHPPPHMHQQQPPPRSRDEPPPPSVAYSSVATGLYDSPRNRSMDEISVPHSHQRNSLLGIQEINRKGRISPLPQAVQGAQPQLAGPTGEPGIKSEFGRMFSGLGTGVGTISSPVPTGAQLSYSAAGLLRREDSDSAPQEQMGGDPPAKSGPNRGKRRKQKDEDVRGDEDSSGRLTPVGGGRAKKPKTHAHHHHQYDHVPSPLSGPSNPRSHHHHHHHHNLEQTSPALSGGNTPFKSVKGSTPVPSPTATFAKDLAASHASAAPRSCQGGAGASPNPPPPVVIPKPQLVVLSKAVLDSVADRPRSHLGDVVYDPILKPARLHDPRTGRPPRSGFSSTPRPLPWGLIEGKENCTLTVKVGKEHLTPAAREEITSRRAVWGTDVYTDDSDVVGACIHAGWIRGEWPDEVDVDLLGLDEGANETDPRETKSRRNGAKSAPPAAPEHVNPVLLTEPPKTGPMVVPENCDLLVTVLILPTLEKYASTTRFGLKSREFGGIVAETEDTTRLAKHDGISFMITGVRWVTDGAASQNRLRGKVRRERIRKALREVELGPAWAGGARNSS